MKTSNSFVFIRPKSDHIGYPVPMSVTHSLTDSRPVDLTDVTSAFEDANSKLLDVVSVLVEDGESGRE